MRRKLRDACSKRRKFPAIYDKSRRQYCRSIRPKPVSRAGSPRHSRSHGPLDSSAPLQINATVFQSPVALGLSSCDAIIGSGKRAPSHEDCCHLLGVPHGHCSRLRERRSATLHQRISVGIRSRWILSSHRTREEPYRRIPLTYANGVQTSTPRLPTGNTVPNLLTDPYNDYVFFVEGKVYRGLVQANVNVSSVAGVLDNGAFNVLGADLPTPTPTVSPTASPSPTVSPTASPSPTVSPTASLSPTVSATASPSPTVSPTASPSPTVSPIASPSPAVSPTVSPTPAPTQSPLVIASNQFLSGFFNGSIDQNSPYAAFHGRGEVTITGTTPVDDSGDSFATVQLFTRKFKFRGVRNATGTTTSSTTTSN